MSDIGHNSMKAVEQLLHSIETIERMEEEKSKIASDIKEEFSALKANGYDTKIVRRIIAIRKDKNAYFEQRAAIEQYLKMLGMVPDETTE